MSFDIKYYEDRQKDLIEQVNKLIQKHTNSEYEFVKEHSELVQKYNQIEQLKQTEAKKDSPKEVPEPAKIVKPAKS